MTTEPLSMTRIILFSVFGTITAAPNGACPGGSSTCSDLGLLQKRNTSLSQIHSALGFNLLKKMMEELAADDGDDDDEPAVTVKSLGEGLGDATNVVVGGVVKGLAVGVIDHSMGGESNPVVAELREDVVEADTGDVGRQAVQQFEKKIWRDVTSHKIEVCMLTVTKSSVSSEFAKCNLGVSCDDCKYFKVEVRAGVDFCQGMKIYAKAEIAQILPTVRLGTLQIATIFERVIEKMPAEIGEVLKAVDLAEQAMETIAENGGVDRYRVTAHFEAEFGWEITPTGAGAAFDLKVGSDLCNKKERCFGMEIAGIAVAKVSGKMFVCFTTDTNPPQIKIEIGAGPFTGSLTLTYVLGFDLNFDLNTYNSIGAAVREKKCMAKPEWRSLHQRVDDGACEGRAGSYYYMGCHEDSHSRRLSVWSINGATPETCSKACAGYEYFGLQYYGQCFCGHGPSLGNRRPTEECNTECTSERSTMCGGSWRNSVYRIVKDDTCSGLSECYSGYPNERRKYCFAEKSWTEKHPNQRDGQCPQNVNKGDCEAKDDCVWRTAPCTNYYTCRSMDRLLRELSRASEDNIKKNLRDVADHCEGAIKDINKVINDLPGMLNDAVDDINEAVGSVYGRRRRSRRRRSRSSSSSTLSDWVDQVGWCDTNVRSQKLSKTKPLDCAAECDNLDDCFAFEWDGSSTCNYSPGVKNPPGDGKHGKHCYKRK